MLTHFLFMSVLVFETVDVALTPTDFFNKHMLCHCVYDILELSKYRAGSSNVRQSLGLMCYKI
jgi:hypothetical protein